MLDLKPLKDLLIEDGHPTACLPKDVLFKVIEEIEFLRSLTKGHCCDKGMKQDVLAPGATSFDENNPFPTFGGVVCHTCNGINVLETLNIRQRKTILDLYAELDQVREEREKIAALLVKK